MAEQLGAGRGEDETPPPPQRFRNRQSNSNSPRPPINITPAVKRPAKVESWAYKSEQKKIHDENIHFLNKLMKQKSQFNQDSWREKREKEEQILKNMCQFPHIFTQTQQKQITPKMKEKRYNEFQRVNQEIMRRESTRHMNDYQHFQSAHGIIMPNNTSLNNLPGIKDRKSSMNHYQGQKLQINTSVAGIADMSTYESSHQGGDFMQILNTEQDQHKAQRYQAQLKPLDLCGFDGIPPDRKVLFRRLLFSPAYHKILIELSKHNLKFYVVVKRYKNDKFKYFTHELYCVQAKKLLTLFDNDYQAMIDATVRVSYRKGAPPVDFSWMDKYLYQLGGDGTPRQAQSELIISKRGVGTVTRNLDPIGQQIARQGSVNVGDMIQESSDELFETDYSAKRGECQPPRHSSMTVQKY
ncbi:hypothetical protein FGO68_gene5103 [Halteria grandinella]|uniref:Uncharacterized protein n=1 Tax=Halteria grandinella TaxID=5974 RepID=A0A8J8NFB1_HALGN|nr:hypothetical protein FGO68_gene5103 [Halteria grandinella]